MNTFLKFDYNIGNTANPSGNLKKILIPSLLLYCGSHVSSKTKSKYLFEYDLNNNGAHRADLIMLCTSNDVTFFSNE